MSSWGRVSRAGWACASILALCAIAPGPAAGSPEAPPAPASSVAEGTFRMVALLERLIRGADPRLNEFMNTARMDLILSQAREEDFVSDPPLLMAVAREMLFAGKTSRAIERFDQLERMMRQRAVDPRSKAWVDLRVQQAIAHIRRGEEENCLLHHSAQSCLFPIRGTGVHSEKRGAIAAAAILTELLRADPGNLQARWLLNIAHMTMGDYPSGVPAAALLPEALFDSQADIGRFPDIAATVGLDVDNLAGGVIADDFDNDGYLDLMLSAMGLASPMHYFRNDAEAGFTERTARAGLTGLVSGLNMVQTDYDNDGHLDVFVLRGAWFGRGGKYPNSLLRNRGDGTFEDVTEVANLVSFHPTQTATWLDYDGDGWLDVFIGNESIPGEPHPCELYRNNGDGTFTECGAEAGVAIVDVVKSVVSGDFNNDGRPDIYASARGGPNRLFRNDGPAPAGVAGRRPGCEGWRFTDVAVEAGVVEPKHSFPAFFWDYDEDGWEDLLVFGFLIAPGDIAADYLGLPHKGERPRLYRNRGDGRFEDVTRAAGLHRVILAMGANYGDFNNDGWLDFYAGTGTPDLGMLLPNRAFLNAPAQAVAGGTTTRRFLDITTSAGLGHLQKGHGVAFADLDNDGDQDLFHMLGGAYETDHYRNALFENPGHGNRFLALKLEGTRSNRPGIGARIEVKLATPRGERTVHRTMRSGGSFGGSPLRIEIGLGDAIAIESVTIAWPAGGARQVVQGLELDSRYQIVEGDPAAVPINLRSFPLGKRAGDSAPSSLR